MPDFRVPVMQSPVREIRKRPSIRAAPVAACCEGRAVPRQQPVPPSRRAIAGRGAGPSMRMEAGGVESCTGGRSIFLSAGAANATSTKALASDRGRSLGRLEAVRAPYSRMPIVPYFAARIPPAATAAYAGHPGGSRAARNSSGDKRHTLAYPRDVKRFRWDPEKNTALVATRGVSYERIVVAIESGGLLDVLRHPNPRRYPRQKVFVVGADGYVYLVPFVEEADGFFLKTIIPSRKATRDYLKRGEPDVED